MKRRTMPQPTSAVAPMTPSPSDRRPGSSTAWLRRAGLRAGAAFAWLRDVVPPTTRGVAVLTLATAALVVWGIRAMDLVLLVVGLTGLGLFAAAFVLVCASALVLTRRLRRVIPSAASLEAGRALPTGLRVPALLRVPLVSVSWSWKEPRGTGVRLTPQDGVLVEEIHATHRAHAPSVTREVVVEDVLALCRVRWRWVLPAPVTILPDVGPLRSMPIVQAIAGGDAVAQPLGRPEGDRMDIRAYVPGDSVRHILWKAYARTRELTVRLPERATAPTKRMVAYLMSGPDDEAAAAAARVALEAGVLGPRWAFGADGSDEVIEDEARAVQAIAASGNPGLRSGLSSFLDRALADGTSHALVFAPARPGEWLDFACTAARRHPNVLSFVIGTDGVQRPQPVALWQRLLLSPGRDARPTAAELSEVLRRLNGVGCRAVVIDRLTGRAYGDAQRERLEAMAQ
jgi:hypothetical protein